MKKLLSIICSIAMLYCTATVTASAVSQEEAHNVPIVSKNENTVRAETLVNESLKDLFQTMGDNYTLFGEYGQLVIEDDDYPSMRFATSYTISDDKHYGTVLNEEKNTIIAKIESGEITLVSVDCFPGVDVMVDNSIKTDMDYLQLTEIIGEFQLATGSLYPSYTMKDSNGNALASFLYSNQNSELVSENGHVSVETMKRVNPKVSRISVYPGYYPVYLEKSSNTIDLVTTALELSKMDLKDIVTMLDGEFEVGEEILKNNILLDPSTYITNEKLLPGIRIYTNFTGSNNDDVETVKNDINSGKRYLAYVVAEDGASFDANIKAGMTYSQLKDTIGNFDCVSNGGKNSYFNNLDDNKGRTALVAFDFNPNYDPEKVGYDWPPIAASVMEKANPKIDYIVVYPSFTKWNTTEIQSNTDNSSTNNDGNTVKSPATSSLGANSSMTMTVFAGAVLLIIAGGISSIAVYKRRKDTL